MIGGRKGGRDVGAGGVVLVDVVGVDVAGEVVGVGLEPDGGGDGGLVWRCWSVAGEGNDDFAGCVVVAIETVGFGLAVFGVEAQEDGLFEVGYLPIRGVVYGVVRAEYDVQLPLSHVSIVFDMKMNDSEDLPSPLLEHKSLEQPPARCTQASGFQ